MYLIYSMSPRSPLPQWQTLKAGPKGPNFARAELASCRCYGALLTPHQRLIFNLAFSIIYS